MTPKVASGPDRIFSASSCQTPTTPRIAPSLGIGTQRSYDSPIGPVTGDTVVAGAGGATVVVVETVEEGARMVAGSVDDGAPVADESGTGAVVEFTDRADGAQPATPAAIGAAPATDMHLVTVRIIRIVS